jgi:hypothetical protein
MPHCAVNAIRRQACTARPTWATSATELAGRVLAAHAGPGAGHDLLLAARLFVVFGLMAGHQAGLSMDAKSGVSGPCIPLHHCKSWLQCCSLARQERVMNDR